MTLEIRPTGSSESFELLDATGKVGEILYLPERDEGWGELEPACWRVTLWSMTGSGKEWGDEVDTLDEAKQVAFRDYPELVAERREGNRPGPGPRTRVISTPMGGQRRK